MTTGRQPVSAACVYTRGLLGAAGNLAIWQYQRWHGCQHRSFAEPSDTACSSPGTATIGSRRRSAKACIRIKDTSRPALRRSQLACTGAHHHHHMRRKTIRPMRGLCWLRAAEARYATRCTHAYQ